MRRPHPRQQAAPTRETLQPQAGGRQARQRQARRQEARAGRPPMPLLAPAALGVAFLLLPLVGLLWRAPWSGLPRLLSDSGTVTALRLSLICASAATVVSVLLGVPLAWVLARARIPGKSALRALITLPLVLPPVVGGVALLLVLGRRGLFGQYLDSWFGITLPFSTAGVVVAETFVAMPFLVVSVEAALRTADSGLGGGGGDYGRRPVVRLPAGHLAAGDAVPGRRQRACLGPGAGRVRRNHHVCGQLSRAGPRPCRWRCTWPWSPTRTPRSR